MSKTRLSFHSLMRQIVMMEKDASSMSKERKLTKMMQNTRFGEACCLHHCYMGSIENYFSLKSSEFIFYFN